MVCIFVVTERVENACFASRHLVAVDPPMTDKICALSPPDCEPDFINDVQIERRNVGDDERGFLYSVDDW
jgi:hypothetical protein